MVKINIKSRDDPHYNLQIYTAHWWVYNKANKCKIQQFLKFNLNVYIPVDFIINPFLSVHEGGKDERTCPPE